MDDPLEGTPYRTLRLLGHGGMGEVVLAEHAELGKRVVVKMLHAHLIDDPRLLERARIEAKALGHLKHPSIVQVTDFGHTPAGRPYLVMERLKGFTLADELGRRGPLGVSESLRLARELLSALELAHGQGIVHRDIKLSNLFIHHPTVGPPVLKVLDFGIAKIVQSVSATAPKPLSLPTEQGVVLGTPRFLSPEAIAGQAVDHRADLYAVGLVLYSLLCGRGPWDDEKRDSFVLVAQVRSKPLPPSVCAKQVIGAELDRAILRALEKQPSDRFQSAAEFEQRLARIQNELGTPAHWHDTVFSADVGVASLGPTAQRRRPHPDTPVSSARAPSTQAEAAAAAPIGPSRARRSVARRMLELVCLCAGVALGGAAGWWLLHWIAG
ncbi:MAG: serine/threonine protein kinase [Polyangiaceae bacterium]|nr:serine/threonine protein kinase [Polyangiaceae bacterium]